MTDEASPTKGSSSPPLSLGVALSGSGTTLQNLLDRAAAGSLPARIATVVSSRKGAGGLERAQRAGVPAKVIPRRSYSDRHSYSRAFFAHFQEARVDLVLLAGFLSRLALPEDFRGRVWNIHPALLPLFGGKGMYGDHVHEAVLASGMKVSGCTVHVVDDEYDHGPIILQRIVGVRFEDTVESLRDRVQAAEREAYPEAVALAAQGRIRVVGSRVQILPPAG